ncbi:glycoprotein 3-alpha-L-fucosyltransferase A-like [Babylonia areolata]|uniref:glycoprotein 3-alpha-L-fucosyltransferase A-like n=1 Tax=Babylonia areolata TaxID=304850 RepID=UPI003FD09D53
MLTPEWSRSFNWTMTYRLDSTVFSPYHVLVYRGEQKNTNYTQVAVNKEKSAAWFVSNCHTPSKRLAYVQELQKHYPVDIFGRCGPLHCPRIHDSSCLSLLNSTYRFYLSFENALCRDYVTEKFFKLFKADMHVIPVVRGGISYRKFFPSGTFVDTSEFTSPLALARYLKNLERDTETYAAMLREKDKYHAVSARKTAMCALCKKLHLDSSPQAYPSFPGWLSKGICWS